MEFEKFTIANFNEKYCVEATKEMSVEEFTDYIESKEIGYLYASFHQEDVEKEAKDFLDETGHECKGICVNGLYLALH